MVGTGAHQIFPAGREGCTGNPMCPVTVAGRVRGFDVFATAFWHPVIVRHGKPPKNALRAPHAHARLFFLGSDVSVGLAVPNALES
jgi:hypothetical protein